jgi:hypothetical protein
VLTGLLPSEVDSSRPGVQTELRTLLVGADSSRLAEVAGNRLLAVAAGSILRGAVV